MCVNKNYLVNDFMGLLIVQTLHTYIMDDVVIKIRYWFIIALFLLYSI